MLIAFRAEGSIYRVNADGADLRVLAGKDASELSRPTISPNGKWVACGHDRVHFPLTILSETGGKRNLGDSTLEAYGTRFSRDGKTLFFNASPHLKRVDVAGGEATILVRGHYIESFDVGPDGRIIAAVPYDNTLSRLAIVDESGAVEYLNAQPDEYHAPTWSPDERCIAFSKRPRYGGGAAKGIFILTLADQQIKQMSDLAFNPTSGLMWR